MQHAKLVAVGKRGDEQIDWWEAVVADACELRLRFDCSPLGGVVEVVLRKGEQFREELMVRTRAARRVARLEQEGKARGDASVLERLGDSSARSAGTTESASRTHAELSSRSMAVTAVPSPLEALPRGRTFGRNVATADPIGEAATKRGGVALLCAYAR